MHGIMATQNSTPTLPIAIRGNPNSRLSAAAASSATGLTATSTTTAVPSFSPLESNMASHLHTAIIRTPFMTPDPDTAMRQNANVSSGPSFSPFGGNSPSYFSRAAKFSHEAAIPAATDATKEQDWNSTIERVIKGIVSIKATTVRAFDTESSGDYTATGFIVDKENGIILSNRHVVNPAPIVATAVFVNYEEIPLVPVYRDPVHDFGFFKYDPSKVKFLDVEQVDLRPDLARIGMQIKVVGNDNGEKLSILGSTLARLDRAAPKYGDDSYNDFNTFYFQATTATSGGSSGSPVVDIAGRAIALNAGGSKRSSTSFYLPLDRVVRALKCIQQGTQITRGTLQTEFVHSSYDELRRLGLPSETESLCRARDPNSTGLLTVAKVLPEGPGHGKLEPGDMIISCNGKDVDGFVSLFETLDNKIGESVHLTLYRGPNLRDEYLTVQDLHSITPDRFLEIGGGIFHDLSYQQARSYGIPVSNQGVFVAQSGMLNWSSLTRNFLVTALNNRPTPNLAAFVEVVRTIPDGKRVPIRHKDLGQSREASSLVQIDHHFHRAQTFVRNDSSGLWDRSDVLLSPIATPPIGLSNDNDDDCDESEGEEEEEQQSSMDVIRQSLFFVNTRLPFSVNGFTSSRPYYGVAVLLSLANGFPLVACDRTAVPSEVVDIRLTISQYAVSARVVAMDKFAYLTFDLRELPRHVKLVVPQFDEAEGFKVKDEVTLVGLDRSYNVVEKKTSLSTLGTVAASKCNPPRFRLVNVEGITVQDPVSCDGGVLVRSSGDSGDDAKICALWLNASSQGSNGNDVFWKTGLSYGVYVKPVVDSILSGSPLLRRTFSFECTEVSMATCAAYGLSSARIKQFTRLSRSQLNLSAVKLQSVYDKFPHHDLATNASNDLQYGDILLEIDGTPILRLIELEKCLRDPSKSSFTFTILREGVEKTVQISPMEALAPATKRVVQWAGAFLQETSGEAVEQTAGNTKTVPLRDGVYVASVSFGAPALNSVRPAQWIVEIDGTPVATLAEFTKLIQTRRWADGDFVRVKQVNRKDVTSVVSVQIDELFWPTRFIERASNGWWVNVMMDKGQECI